MDFLPEMMEKGGFFMWPILACAVFGAAIGLERFLYVYLRAGINGPAFWGAVQRLVLDGQTENAVKLCNAEPSALLPRVIKAGLVRAGQPDEEIKDGIEEVSLEVYPLINRRMGFLPMIANVSTLLGLLGTIQGLIQAFHSIESSTADARSVALASGIAVAMYTTFAGLVISIPLLVLHSIVAARANLVLDEIDHYAVKVRNLLRAVQPAEPGRGGAPVLPFRS